MLSAVDLRKQKKNVEPDLDSNCFTLTDSVLESFFKVNNFEKIVTSDKKITNNYPAYKNLMYDKANNVTCVPSDCTGKNHSLIAQTLVQIGILIFSEIYHLNILKNWAKTFENSL